MGKISRFRILNIINKTIFPSKRFRLRVLRILYFIPDYWMLKIQYFLKFGRILNLDKPERFTEKLQHYKINYRNPLLHRCSDKLLVRNYLKSLGLEKYLVNLYGIYDNPSDINIDELPLKFVIKTTDGGGGENIVICKNKNQLDESSIKSKLNRWKGKQIDVVSREWGYKNQNSKLIIEELLEDFSNPSGINDYKFFCFKGKVHSIVVDTDRYIDHKRNIFDLSWIDRKIETDHKCSNFKIPKPKNFEEMVTLAEKLSSQFPFVRVDLYNISGKIYFGELTFYPWSGYVQFNPDMFDFELGKHFSLDY